MNKKIKEMLDYIKSSGSTTELALLDYITNLQHTIKDNEDTLIDKNECIDLLETQLTNLQQENERLKNHSRWLEDKIETYFDNVNAQNDLLIEQLDYKSRCEKAIKYYKTHQQECVIGRNKDDRLIRDYYLPSQCSKILLKILQGSEVNEC